MDSQRDEFAEVRVFRDDHAFFDSRELEESVVDSTTSLQIGDNMDCVMACGAQGDGYTLQPGFASRARTGRRP